MQRIPLIGMGARNILRRLGYAAARADGAVKPAPLLLQLIWRHYHTTLDPKQLIDGQPLSESKPIKPYNAAGANYIDWLMANAADADALESQNFGGVAAPGAKQQSLGEAFREAMDEKGFHLLFWGYFVCGFHIAMLTVHLPGGLPAPRAAQRAPPDREGSRDRAAAAR